jgi:hypothetical protein
LVELLNSKLKNKSVEYLLVGLPGAVASNADVADVRSGIEGAAVVVVKALAAVGEVTAPEALLTSQGLGGEGIV